MKSRQIVIFDEPIVVQMVQYFIRGAHVTSCALKAKSRNWFTPDTNSGYKPRPNITLCCIHSLSPLFIYIISAHLDEQHEITPQEFTIIIS